MANIDLRLGDCFEGLKGIPDKSIDLVVTDPPYKISTTGGGLVKGTRQKNYDNIRPIASGYDSRIIPELVRVLKRVNLYIFVSHAQLLQTLETFTRDYDCNYTLIAWHKSNPIPTCNNTYLKDTEYCIHFRERGVELYGDYHTKRTWYVTGVNKDKDLYKHPTIKPLQIIANMIINSSREGDLVLDPFTGSGTTGVACMQTGRNFIGFEINPAYYQIAQKRIEEAQCQLVTIS